MKISRSRLQLYYELVEVAKLLPRNTLGRDSHPQATQIYPICNSSIWRLDTVLHQLEKHHPTSQIDELIKNPINHIRFMEESIIVNMMSLGLFKKSKKKQKRYLKKLLRRMKKQV